MKTKSLCLLAMVASLAVAIPSAAPDDAADLPAGAGKELVVKVCIDCHSTGNFRKMRLTEDEWYEKVGDMVDRGAKADDAQQKEIVGYLVRNFGKDSKIYMNTAPFGELLTVLGLTVDEGKAVVAYRTDHGPFKDLGDVMKVPGVDAKKLQSQSGKMAF
jgi:competence protein ComEA